MLPHYSKKAAAARIPRTLQHIQPSSNTPKPSATSPAPGKSPSGSPAIDQLDICLGAIHALKRIARDSEADRRTMPRV